MMVKVDVWVFYVGDDFKNFCFVELVCETIEIFDFGFNDVLV